MRYDDVNKVEHGVRHDDSDRWPRITKSESTGKKANDGFELVARAPRVPGPMRERTVAPDKADRIERVFAPYNED